MPMHRLGGHPSPLATLPAGRTICKLHLPEGALHSDLNGDGVVDHVSVFAGSLDADSSLSSDKHKGHLSHCAVELTSGIPPRQQVFTASICDTQHLDLAARLTGQGAAQYDDAPHTLQVGGLVWWHVGHMPDVCFSCTAATVAAGVELSSN